MFNKSYSNSAIDFPLFLLIMLIFPLAIFGLLITENIFIAGMLLALMGSVFIFITAPQITLFLFGCFLLFQPLIAAIIRLRIIQNLDEALILSFFIIMVVKKIIKREPFIRTPIGIPLLCFVTIGMLSTILGRVVTFPVSLGGLLLSVKGFLLFYIFTNTYFDERHLRFFMKGFFLVGLFLAFYGLLGILSPRIFLMSLGFVPNPTRFGFVAAQSLFGHPGAFSALMAILACYSISTVLNKGDKKFIAITIFLVICIILSFRRTSLLGLILAFIIMFFLKLPLKIKSKKVKRNIFVILLCILLIFSGFIASMYKDLLQTYVLSGDTPRSMLFSAGVKVSMDYFPLGSGFGTFGSGINRAVYSPLFYKYGLSRIWGLSPDKPDFTNDTFWPHVLAETGTFGLLFYLLIIVGLFRICIKAIATLDKSMLKIFALGAFMALVISLIESTKATFYEMSLWTYFYFGNIGILWALSSKISPKHS